METIEKLIGKKVMAARIEAKMSQSELAFRANTSLTTINRLENGRQFPNKRTRADIAAALNKSESELFLELSDDSETHPKTRHELVGAIVYALASLNDSELRQVQGFINDLADLNTPATFKAPKSAADF